MILTTPYEEMMDTEIPHNYHPTPQFRRNACVCLNGKWDFSIDENEYASNYTTSILVPFCPESRLSGIKKYVLPKHHMHYRRFFTLPDSFNGCRTILHFGAVDQICTVSLNGKYLGGHSGGYTPFSFDITDVLKDGQNELRVDARDGIDKNLPYGKQKYNNGGMWYTPVSGIWQTVWLECIPMENSIKNIKITPYEKGVTIEVYGGADEKSITLKESSEVFNFTGNSVKIEPKDIKRWTPDEPYLYHFTLTSGDDRIESYFAIRWIGVENINGVNRLCLNGKPYLFNGLLDQGYYPDGIYTPASAEAYEDDIIKAKKLGFNMLRKHIKIEPMIFYYLCDKLGIAVFQDMVNNGKYSFVRDTALPTISTNFCQRLNDIFFNLNKNARKIFEANMYLTASHLYNTPSVVYYTVFNEGWGQFCADEMYERLKKHDKTRMIDTTSGWFRRRKSDVDSRHIYFRKLMPKYTNGKPLVISEFGGYAYQEKDHVYSRSSYGYKTLQTKEEYENAVCTLYDTEVRELVKGGASAFVYTQLSDVEDEINGLITYDRRIMKITPERIEKINRELREISES